MIFHFKKTLKFEPDQELVRQIKEYEDIINTPMTIWNDEEEFKFFEKINKLTLEERRLFIIYSIYNANINRVAALFNVDRKTIDSRITEIKNKLCI